MTSVNIYSYYYCNYALRYHFAFVMKYWQKCLANEMLDRLKDIVSELFDS